MYTILDRIYSNIQRHKKIHDPVFQGKRYKDDSGAMLLNWEENLGYIRTEEDKIKQELGITMTHEYIIKAVFKRFGENREHAVT